MTKKSDTKHAVKHHLHPLSDNGQLKKKMVCA